MRTNSTGAVAATYSSLPWGDGYSANVSKAAGDQDSAHFAGQDQDLNSANAAMSEHAQFRNYSFQQGRWMSPDPYDGSYDITNPQSFNRYAYALNNPLSLRDPCGLDVCSSDPCDGNDGGGGDSGGDGDGGSDGDGSGSGDGNGASQDSGSPIDLTGQVTLQVNAYGVAFSPFAFFELSGFQFNNFLSASFSGEAAALLGSTNPHTQCPPGTYADTSGTPDYQGGATEYGVNADGTPTRFAGRRTAGGSIFDPWGYTAATIQGPKGERWTIPRNTFLNVVSANNPSANVVVQITDTGLLGPGDVIDLSAGAMKTLTGKPFNSVPVKIYTCRAR